MADPLSLIANITGIIGACGQLAVAIRDIRNAVKGASATLQGIAVECTTTAAVLQRLEALIRDRPQLLTGGATPSVGGASMSLKDSFDVLLQEISASTKALASEVQRISSRTKNGDGLGATSKAMFVWKEDFLKECRNEMREQRSSLSFLLDCIHTESLAQIQFRLERAVHLTNGQTSSGATTAAPNSPISVRLNQLSLSGRPKQRLCISMIQRELDLPQTQKLAQHIRLPPGKKFRTNDPVLVQSFHTAIEDWDVHGVTKALSKRVHPSALLPNSSLSPLCRTLRFDRPAGKDSICEARDTIIYALVLAGANLSMRDGPNKNTPLITAVVRNYPARVIRLMCEMGAEVDAVGNDGDSALHCCAALSSPSEDVLRALVAHGADLERRETTTLGASPLWWAVRANSANAVGFVTKMLDYGCDPNAETSTGETPLRAALLCGSNASVQMVRLLCERGASTNVDMRIRSSPDDAYFECLTFAISRQCSIEVARVLIQSGANINGGGQLNECTPLGTAAARGNLDMVKFLVDTARANIEQLHGSASRRATPLYWAVSRAEFDVARFLVDRGADPNARPAEDDSQGDMSHTTLYWAVRNKNDSFVRLLLDHGSLPDTMSRLYDQTPLQYAAARGQLDAMRILIEHGAYIDCKDLDGETPLVYALKHRQDAAAVLLIHAGVDIALPCTKRGLQPLHFAAAFGMNEVVDLLLGLGAVVDALSSPEGFTPLMAAVREGQISTARLLLDRGATLNAVDEAGENIIGYAVQHPAILQFVLGRSRRASADSTERLDVNATNEVGWTALHEAAAKAELVSVRTLLEHGSRQAHCSVFYPTDKDFEAKTNATSGMPAEIARALGREEVAKLIEGWN